MGPLDRPRHLLFVLFFAVTCYLAGRSLVKWGNVQGIRMLAGVPVPIGVLGVFNGVRRVTAGTAGLLIGFVAVLAYGVVLFVLPGHRAGRAWLAARQRWAAA
ncbi:MAG TPA: hypothetical protein VGP31_18530 [Planosporangium sp.]|jgi:hypothetical protein|nr:hypothetical protein [Planosporangium sp.]